MSKISITKRITLLQHMELLSQLNYEELEVMAANSQLVKYKRGSVIFAEESRSSQMYVIKSGEVLITKHQDKGEIDIARFIAGESFGEWDLIGDTAHNATATALNDAELLVFPGKGSELSKVLQRYPGISARMLNKMLGMIASRIRMTNRVINEKTPWIQSLKKQMMVDKLTGLYNRNFLLNDFDAMLSKSDEPVALLMIKPDNLKEVNDLFGHFAGDRTLILLAIFFQSALRETDMAIRYDGDEFAAVLPNASYEEAIWVARELSESTYGIDTTRITGGKNIKITVSIGISLHPMHGSSARGLIQKAHEKMLEAFYSGGKRIIADR